MEMTVCIAENVRETEGKNSCSGLEDPFRSMTGKDAFLA